MYFQEAFGRAKNKDKSFLKTSTTLEERIVIFFVESYKKAVQLAEKDAKKYSKGSFINIYGETIITKYSGCYDAIEMFEEPKHGSEIFGAIDLFLTKSEMKKALKIKAGVFHDMRDRSLRMRFHN